MCCTRRQALRRGEVLCSTVNFRWLVGCAVLSLCGIEHRQPGRSDQIGAWPRPAVALPLCQAGAHVAAQLCCPARVCIGAPRFGNRKRSALSKAIEVMKKAQLALGAVATELAVCMGVRHPCIIQVRCLPLTPPPLGDTLPPMPLSAAT